MEKTIKTPSDIRKINSLFDNQVYANVEDLMKFIDNMANGWKKVTSNEEEYDEEIIIEAEHKESILNTLYFKIMELLC